MRKFTGNRLLVATHNQGKLEEISKLLEVYDIAVMSSKDLGLPEPAETEIEFCWQRPDQSPCCRARG